MEYSVTLIWSDGELEHRRFLDKESLVTKLPDLIRQFGKEKVAVFDSNLSFVSYEDLGLDVEDIESDRYPELDLEVDGKVVYIFIPADREEDVRYLLKIPTEDVPEHLLEEWSMLLDYVKLNYDDSLIDTYYLQGDE